MTTLECDGLPSFCYRAILPTRTTLKYVSRHLRIPCNKATAGRRTPKLNVYDELRSYQNTSRSQTSN